MHMQEIAQRLHQLVQAGEYFTAYEELFSPEVVAREPQLAAMGLEEVKGREALQNKVSQLGAGIAELVSREMSEPIVTASHIAFTNKVHAKLKDGQDFRLDEICLYQVEAGKIISEEFIY